MNWRFWFLIIACSCLDLGLSGLMSKPFPYLLRALYYVSISFHASLVVILFTAFLSSFQLFFISGTFGSEFLLMAPLGALFYYLCSYMRLPRAVLALLISGALLLHGVFDRIQGGIPIDSMGVLYTFLSACFVVYLGTGSQGNRSFNERKVRTPNEKGTLGN